MLTQSRTELGPSPDQSARNPDNDFPHIKGYVVTGKLGQGGGGSVFEAYTVERQQRVAIKRVSLTKYDQIKTEKNIQLHQRLKGARLHYVVRVLDVVDDKVWPLHKLIVMPKHLFSLDRLILYYHEQKTAFPQDHARLVIVHVVSGLLELHQYDSICHRDLKSDNIMLSGIDEKGGLRAFAGDLGVSRSVDSSAYAHTNVGAASCKAPEVLFARNGDVLNYKPQPVDVWGAGVLVYQMVIGEKPLPRTFREDPEVDFGIGVAKKHINAHIRVYQDQARGRKHICQFMRDCLQFDPSDRPALEKLLSHPWLKGPDRPALQSIPCPDALRETPSTSTPDGQEHALPGARLGMRVAFVDQAEPMQESPDRPLDTPSGLRQDPQTAKASELAEIEKQLLMLQARKAALLHPVSQLHM